MQMTQEQQRIVAEALSRGLVKNAREAYEAGCAALRRQLHELRQEEEAKLAAAARAEAEAIARSRPNLF